ncbi:Hpt domain-containing protein [Palleronia sediminis]|nr:Hpt domain-containing protein [Palleronia sediminis]
MLIDESRLSTLISDVGADSLGELLDIFERETGQKIASLAACPPERLSAAYHFVKGSAQNLGLAELAALCRQAEHDAARGVIPDAARVRDCFHASFAALRARCD